MRVLILLIALLAGCAGGPGISVIEYGAEPTGLGSQVAGCTITVQGEVTGLDLHVIYAGERCSVEARSR